MNVYRLIRRTEHEHGRQGIPDGGLQPLQQDVAPERGGVALGEAEQGARRAGDHRRCFTTESGNRN